MKKEAKKVAAKNKVETFKTGGGTRDPAASLSADHLQILAILGPAGTGRDSSFDGDSIPNGVEDLQLIDCSTIDVPSNPVQGEEHTWANGDVCPRMLYNRKPPELVVTQEANVQIDVVQSGPSCSKAPDTALQDLKRKTIADEQEWAEKAKRRRPTVSKEGTQEALELVAAKLDLAKTSKRYLDEEATRKAAEETARKQRDEELFQLEKKKKEMEAKIAELQYLQMLKTMGLPVPDQK